jgi:hypothetical protein
VGSPLLLVDAGLVGISGFRRRAVATGHGEHRNTGHGADGAVAAPTRLARAASGALATVEEKSKGATWSLSSVPRLSLACCGGQQRLIGHGTQRGRLEQDPAENRLKPAEALTSPAPLSRRTAGRSALSLSAVDVVANVRPAPIPRQRVGGGVIFEPRLDCHRLGRGHGFPEKRIYSNSWSRTRGRGSLCSRSARGVTSKAPSATTGPCSAVGLAWAGRLSLKRSALNGALLRTVAVAKAAEVAAVTGGDWVGASGGRWFGGRSLPSRAFQAPAGAIWWR